MTTSAMALEMAWGMDIPPMASAMRSIATATEAIWIHAAHLAVRAGPDFCAPVVQRTSPRLWRRAASTRAPGAALHGYKTIGELMEGLVPVSGRYWTETIPAGRRVQQMINLLYGKYPHPSVLIPGGLTQTLSIGSFTEYFTRIYLSVDYVKEVVALWDDLIDFLYEADPRFVELGARPASFIHAGCWDDVRALNSYEALDETGRRRLAGPGVMVDGQLVTESLRDVHSGIEEDVSHSFYERWEASGGADPAGASLPAGHPWYKRTIPKPAQADPEGAYSWSTAPRWRGEVVESTPLGRLWLTALRNDLPPNEFIESTGKSVRILVPLNMYPEMVVEWKIPERVNALERLRADAYGIAFAGLCAAISLLRGFELTRTGEVDRHVSFKVKKGPSAGVGLWESGRGMNVHWVRMDKGRMTGYQILGPSTWNASPRDGSGKLGPLEEALVGSPIMEEPGDDGSLSGIDALRVIHSFDPCMNCAVH
jgi:hydrogenase large subunit